MLIRKYVLYSLVSILFAAFSTSYAQDNYQEWLKKEKASYQDFLEEEDKAFSDFLKKEWKAFLSSQGIKFDEKPKPQKPGRGLTEYVIRSEKPVLITPEIFEELMDAGG